MHVKVGMQHLIFFQYWTNADLGTHAKVSIATVDVANLKVKTPLD